jgi:hypothetical protein
VEIADFSFPAAYGTQELIGRAALPNARVQHQPPMYDHGARRGNDQELEQPNQAPLRFEPMDGCVQKRGGNDDSGRRYDKPDDRKHLSFTAEDCGSDSFVADFIARDQQTARDMVDEICAAWPRPPTRKCVPLAMTDDNKIGVNLTRELTYFVGRFPAHQLGNRVKPELH